MSPSDHDALRSGLAVLVVATAATAVATRLLGGPGDRAAAVVLSAESVEYLPFSAAVLALVTLDGPWGSPRRLAAAVAVATPTLMLSLADPLAWLRAAELAPTRAAAGLALLGLVPAVALLAVARGRERLRADGRGRPTRAVEPAAGALLVGGAGILALQVVATWPPDIVGAVDYALVGMGAALVALLVVPAAAVAVTLWTLASDRPRRDAAVLLPVVGAAVFAVHLGLDAALAAAPDLVAQVWYVSPLARGPLSDPLVVLSGAALHRLVPVFALPVALAAAREGEHDPAA